MQKLTLPIAIAALVAAGVFVFLTGAGKISLHNQYTMSVASIQQTDSTYDIHVEYPQFEGLDGLNQEVSSMVNTELASFKQNVQDYMKARQATATPENPAPTTPSSPFSFIASWQPSQINGQYISFVVNIYYFSGGAHGLNEIHTYNYDIKNKKDITITDFLGNSQPSLNNLAALARIRVTSQLQSSGLQMNSFVQQMIATGTAPTAKNYQAFTFNFNSLTLYFQQYQVAPGSAGSVAVTLYKGDLKNNSVTTGYIN